MSVWGGCGSNPGGTAPERTGRQTPPPHSEPVSMEQRAGIFVCVCLCWCADRWQRLRSGAYALLAPCLAGTNWVRGGSRRHFAPAGQKSSFCIDRLERSSAAQRTKRSPLTQGQTGAERRAEGSVEAE
eukprot:scaffold72755_cov18-Tisochrysis_lutea.AAC.1